MTRLLALLLLGLIMPEACRLLYRLNMSMEMPEPFLILPATIEWEA